MTAGAPFVLALTLLMQSSQSRVELRLLRQLCASGTQPLSEVVEFVLATHALPHPRLPFIVDEPDGKALAGVVREKWACHSRFPKAGRFDDRSPRFLSAQSELIVQSGEPPGEGYRAGNCGSARAIGQDLSL
ncbi:MAG TPA: hypothetical protein EYQ83_01165, partial [Acidobacteria bacterium]|nr:hypothetical protein [Acidobacteriota bacterium]